MKIQLWSHPVNMQPDKTKCYPQLYPLQRYGLLPPRCWVHLAEAPLQTVRHYTWIGTAGFGGGAAGYWNVTLATTRRQAFFDVLSPIFDVEKGKMWWLIEICINCVVHRSFSGYHELSGDLKLCWCQMIAGYFWIQCHYDNQSGTEPNLVAKFLATKIGNLWA